ncbi:hypothetical protein HELRODRAFT_116410 [Helobdella robusta]|uniref:Uncharacterized protein n=1 Tax=Helobdella robusta TaxID=6412 RepID=T1EGE7_HELRO|nr:hypothetical protein HELRODRAFT_116410 [Helobdella robusta]ESN91030.1 hypothetical protein HELRODRAFT_116410 [Helobdella robusta]
MKLTDIRLEALSSAHQLEHLKETMNRMKNEMMSLKVENDRMQQMINQRGLIPQQQQQQLLSSPSSTTATTLSSSLSLSSSTSLSSPTASFLPSSSSTNSIATTISKDQRLSLDPSSYDLLLMDSGRRESQRITLSVRRSGFNTNSDYTDEILISTIQVSGGTTWTSLMTSVKNNFKDYLVRLDSQTCLGLGGESVSDLHIADVTWSPSQETSPELLPCGYLVGDNTNVSVALRDSRDGSVDSLSFESLIPKSILQRYISLMAEHKCVVFYGSSAVGKSYLARKLAQHLVLSSGKEMRPSSISTLQVNHSSQEDLRQYLNKMAVSRDRNSTDLPEVIILDDLHHVTSFCDVFDNFLNGNKLDWPYIIGTTRGSPDNISNTNAPNFQLHRNVCFIRYTTNTEPVKNFLERFLKRRWLEVQLKPQLTISSIHENHGKETATVLEWLPKLWKHLNKFIEEHSSNDAAIGPHLFLACPMDFVQAEAWFLKLWNFKLLSYMTQTVRDGLQTYGVRVLWEDPAGWVVRTSPWTALHATPSLPVTSKSTNISSNTALNSSAADTFTSSHNVATSGDDKTWPQLLRIRPEEVGYDVSKMNLNCKNGNDINQNNGHDHGDVISLNTKTYNVSSGHITEVTSLIPEVNVTSGDGGDDDDGCYDNDQDNDNNVNDLS